MQLVVVKTKDLRNLALDYTIANCYMLGPEIWRPLDPTAPGSLSKILVPQEDDSRLRYNPSGNWLFAGPLFEQEEVVWRHLKGGVVEAALMSGEIGVNRKRSTPYKGDGYLMSGLRAIIGEFYGATVNIPKELERYCI